MFVCKCVPTGQPSPHSQPRQCAANRTATGVYLRSISAAPVGDPMRGKSSTRRVIHPVTGRFLRWATTAEGTLLVGTAVPGVPAAIPGVTQDTPPGVVDDFCRTKWA